MATLATVPLKILLVVTSQGQLGQTPEPTGYYLSEVTHPYFKLADTGYEVDIASPQGGKAPMDPKSHDMNDAFNKRFMNTPELVKKLDNTLVASQIKSSDYIAIFFAGGHGTMWDFPDNADLAKVTSDIYEKGGVVAAVCHGPAALLNVKLKNGKHLVAGKNVTSFTNDEEEAVKMTPAMPFLLESKLVERGAKFSKAPVQKAHVVVDGRLVTGQNPASALGTAERVSQLLKKDAKIAHR